MSEVEPELAPRVWLYELVRQNRARWPWHRSIRLVLALAIPMAIAFATHQEKYLMLVSLGTIMASMGERPGPYRLRIKKMFVTATMGALGFLFGGIVGSLNWPFIVVMVLLGLVAAFLSSFGAVASNAAMVFLLFTVLGASLDSGTSGPIWIPPLLILGGTGIALVLLILEAVTVGKEQQRQYLADFVQAMAQYARASAAALQLDTAAARHQCEQEREQARVSSRQAYQIFLNHRSRSDGPDQQDHNVAAMLANLSDVAPYIIGGLPSATLIQGADALEQLSQQVRHPGRGTCNPVVIDSSMSEVERDYLRLINEAIEQWQRFWRWDPTPAMPEGHAPTTKVSLMQQMKRHILARSVWGAGIQLSVCLGIAGVVMKWVPGQRSYWIALTVVVILKPDFGSIFVRAVHRSLGTIVGVLIGTLCFAIIPPGPVMLVAMLLFAAAIPWANLKSYALQAVFYTPLILLLTNYIEPDSTQHFGSEKLIDTLVGAAIVLIFGYALWPWARRVKVSESFEHTLDLTATYLDTARRVNEAGSANASGAGAPEVTTDATSVTAQELRRARQACWRELTNVHVHLQRSLSEPPPTCHEAAAWVPAVAALSRLEDTITRLALTHEFAAMSQEECEKRTLAIRSLTLDALAHLRAHPLEGSLSEVDRAILQLSQLTQQVHNPPRSQHATADALP